MLVVINNITYMISVCYLQRWRRRLSCFKKGVFNVQEGHVLECSKASSCFFLGLFLNGAGIAYWNNSTNLAYTNSILFSFIDSFVGFTSLIVLLPAGVVADGETGCIGVSSLIIPLAGKVERMRVCPHEYCWLRSTPSLLIINKNTEKDKKGRCNSSLKLHYPLSSDP